MSKLIWIAETWIDQPEAWKSLIFDPTVADDDPRVKWIREVYQGYRDYVGESSLA